MYAGDSTPWSISLIQQNGNPYPYSSLKDASASLTLMPYTVLSGIGDNAEIVDPVVSIDGELTGDPSGTCTLRFSLRPEDTLSLRGKFIYQIDVFNDTDRRISQGVVTIKPNINRN